METLSHTTMEKGDNPYNNYYKEMGQNQHSGCHKVG